MPPLLDIIHLLLLLLFTSVQDIYNRIPETNHVSRVYNVAAILWLQFMVQVMLSLVLNVLYFYVSAFQCLQCPIWFFLSTMMFILSAATAKLCYTHPNSKLQLPATNMPDIKRNFAPTRGSCKSENGVLQLKFTFVVQCPYKLLSGFLQFWYHLQFFQIKVMKQT
jgi:hypothetical protein